MYVYVKCSARGVSKWYASGLGGGCVRLRWSARERIPRDNYFLERTGWLYGTFD